MTEVDKQKAQRCSELWTQIAGYVAGCVDGGVADKTFRDFADVCVHTITGKRTGKLDKRIEEIEEGPLGEGLFLSLIGVRLKSALAILEDIRSYFSDNEVSEGRAKCVLSAIVLSFKEGGKAISKYEKERINYRFPGKGVKIYITDGQYFHVAEVVEANLVGASTPSNEALMVVSPRFEGAYATPGNLQKLYSTLFPEDTRKFRVPDRYLWRLNVGEHPSGHSKEAKRIAEKAWNVSSDEPREVNPGGDLVLDVETMQGLKPMVRNRVGSSFIWKDITPFSDVLSKVVSREIAAKCANGEAQETSEEKKPYDGLDLTKPIPSDMASFKKEHAACQAFIDEIAHDVEVHSKAPAMLEEEKKKLAEQQKVVDALQQVVDSPAVSDEDMRCLGTIHERFEGMYAIIPEIAKTLKDRDEVFKDITDVLRPLSGELSSSIKKP